MSYTYQLNCPYPHAEAFATILRELNPQRDEITAELYELWIGISKVIEYDNVTAHHLHQLIWQAFELISRGHDATFESRPHD